MACVVLEEYIESRLACSACGEDSPPREQDHMQWALMVGQDQRVGIAASQLRLRFVSIRCCAQPVAADA